MPWCEPSTVPFTRIDIVCHVPAAPGVFGILENGVCLYVGDTWNLRGRLLELANLISDQEALTIVWEKCPESQCGGRRLTLENELLSEPELISQRFPGIQLRRQSSIFPPNLRQ